MTEDALAFRADPEAFDHEPPGIGLAVLALGLDAVGHSAAVRAKEQAEAVLGALWLLDAPDDGPPPGPPWLLGGANRADSPRDPPGDEDSGLPIVGLQVDTRSGKTAPVRFEARQHPVPTAKVLENDLGLVDLVAGAEAPDPAQALARRVAAACRLAWVSGQDTSPDLRLLHLLPSAPTAAPAAQAPAPGPPRTRRAT